MKKNTLRRLLFLSAAAVSLGASASAVEPVLEPVVTVAISSGNVADGIHAKVNAYRKSIGKPALQRHAGLDKLARQHSEFMRRNRGKFSLSSTGNISHFGFEGRTLAARRGLGMSDISENIGTCGGAGNAAGTLVEAWKKSRGHNLNLKGSWTQTGIGVVVDSDGTVFATQIFGIGGNSHMGMTERLRSF